MFAGEKTGRLDSLFIFRENQILFLPVETEQTATKKHITNE